MCATYSGPQQPGHEELEDYQVGGSFRWRWQRQEMQGRPRPDEGWEQDDGCPEEVAGDNDRSPGVGGFAK